MKIDKNYTASSDTYGWTLTFSEERERTKKDGTKEIYMYEDHSYHATLKQSLIRYLDLRLKGSEDVKEVLKRIEEVEGIIKKLKI